MFDFSFGELLIVMVVALVVIGPEQLPKVARTIGAVVGRAQRYIAEVKSEVQREMQLEDMKNLHQSVAAEARALETSLRAGIAGIEENARALQAQAGEAMAAFTVTDEEAQTPAPPGTETTETADAAPAAADDTVPQAEAGAPQTTPAPQTAAAPPQAAAAVEDAPASPVFDPMKQESAHTT
ncbi:MAG: twin-arginine translocase subunit TatB [Rhodocyclaceae bacterium]|nr:twin-arginine translocase subunit TatB [Rhodocyclaceae bacterium]